MTSWPHFRRTRIAPTPSGFLHQGNAFSFALTASLAKKTGAKLLLRIDDLDRQRVRKDYIQDIFDTLRYLNISWEEGPRFYEEYEAHYAQVNRMGLYQNTLRQLQEKGHLFACTCSRTQVLQNHPDGIYQGRCARLNIPLETPDVSWRLITNPSKKIMVKSLSGSYTTTYLPPAMQYFVVRKKDGFPAYQLTSVADDLHYGVDLIVRGADLWSSTLAQLYLALLLEQQAFLEASFYHHTLFKDESGNKLSKSGGAQSIMQLRKSGKPPKEVYALIAQCLSSEEGALIKESGFINLGNDDR